MPPPLPQLPFVAKHGQRAFAEHSRPGPPHTDYDCTVKMAHRASIVRSVALAAEARVL